jgi:hypothetical protein
MSARAIKTMLFILACATVMLFAARLASANSAMIRPAPVASRASSELKVSGIAVEKAAPEAQSGMLLLLGMGLVLTGTALRRKESKTE